MKKIVFSAIMIFIIVITVIIVIAKKSPSKNQDNVLPSKTKRILQKEVVLDDGKIMKTVYNGREYTILAVLINDTDNLFLIPNFTEKYYAEDVSSNMECDFAINAGFYKENNSPLGLFYSNGVQLGKTAKSSVAKGFFIQYKDNRRIFSYDSPQNFNQIDFVFQSGPLTQVRDIKIPMLRDEFARRSLMGWDGQNHYLLSVFSSDNFYEGPLLSDIPSIFKSDEVQNEIPFSLLLNLDGGSASFFYSRNKEEPFILSSFTNVGSIICLKK